MISLQIQVIITNNFYHKCFLSQKRTVLQIRNKHFFQVLNLNQQTNMKSCQTKIKKNILLKFTKKNH